VVAALGSLASLLGDPTVQTVVLGSALLGATAGALGTFAVLRRQSLLGDAMSHAALPGVVMGYFVSGGRHLGAILIGALLAGLAAALFALFLSRQPRIKEEAALGAALSLGFALGVVLLTVAQKQATASHAGLDTFLFGQAAATLRSDLVWLGGLAAVAGLILAVLWRQAKLATFDRDFAAVSGVAVPRIEALLTALLAFAIVIGLQLVGVVLMSSLVVAPAVAARQWSGSIAGMVLLAGAIGLVSAVIGAVLSALSPGLSTGPLVVLVATAAVAISLVFGRPSVRGAN